MRVANLMSVNTTHDAKRDGQVDFLRGAAMVLVLLHHSGFPLGGYILAFHMPLFFVISGYLEHLRGGVSRKPLGDYAKRRCVRLVVPYFAFELVNLFIWCAKCLLEHSALPGVESLVSIALCVNDGYLGMYGRLWFLPCMFVTDMYVQLALRASRGDGLAQLLSALVFFALSFLTSTFIPFRLPFTTDTALFGAGFMMLGIVFGGQIRRLLSPGDAMCKVLLALGMLLYLVYAVRYTGATVLMYVNAYGEYTVSICAAIAGCVAFLVIGGWTYGVLGRTWLGSLVLWYGRDSLACFPVHLTIKMFVLWYTMALSPWYIMFPLMLLLDVPIVNAISRYLPFMLGRRMGKGVG